MNATTNTGFLVSTVFLVLSVGGASAQDRPYNPLAISDQLKTETLDITVHDEKRSREIPIRVYLPAGKMPAPVVLFSHGLGGSRGGSAYLGKHWAARGYVAVFLQHPGSDESVWKDVPPAQRMSAMQEAANLRNTLLRLKDVPEVLDQLGRWSASSGHPLTGRLDLKRVGMSGHSFGAVTTEAVSGQRDFRGSTSFTDERIRAAIAFSPSSPRRGDPKQAFGGVKIPWLLMTGTKDIAPIGNADIASRLAVFPALPAGGKYELVLEGAEHSAFNDRALPGDTEKRNPNHHRAILAISTAFWDAWLRGDAAAMAWLSGDGPRSVLEKNDRWQKK
jgi:predicted dienelactone hydrolase